MDDDFWFSLFPEVVVGREANEPEYFRYNSPRGADETAALRGKVARLELTVEALLEILWVRGLVTREEVSLAIQRIDLADGVEDGRVGPDRSAAAPRCPHCGRPINPLRSHCVFCAGKLEPTATRVGLPPKVARPKASAPRQNRCSECGKVLTDDETHFRARGLYCESCFGK